MLVSIVANGNRSRLACALTKSFHNRRLAIPWQIAPTCPSRGLPVGFGGWVIRPKAMPRKYLLPEISLYTR